MVKEDGQQCMRLPRHIFNMSRNDKKRKRKNNKQLMVK